MKADDPKAKDLILSFLRDGKIVFAPTDTIYGLLARAGSKEAVERLYNIRRPSGKPFLVLLGDKSQAYLFDLLIKPWQLDILDLHVTVVFQKRTSLPLYLTRGRKSIGLRLLKEGVFLKDILIRLGDVVVAPSANPEGQKPASCVEEAMEYFGDSVDLYVDAGRLEGKPSTVVRVVGNGIRPIREGNVPFEHILNFWKKLKGGKKNG
ncbi:L-threonylcarbamoyladenylate synthase [Thermocrinis minervae]|uniref:L-threonylcarbamoyladenylate synthase n=1 Tax=Thermocrinis minervae TaxID=381751 RepID=UPI001E4ADBE6|nr:L-threonylcarbamoyladenylate synthase [Thermocrinis minervae]